MLNQARIGSRGRAGVAGEASNNSALALGRLRELIRARASGGESRLPTERELAESLGLGRRAVGATPGRAAV